MEYLPTVVLDREEQRACAEAVRPYRMVFDYPAVTAALVEQAVPGQPSDADRAMKLGHLVGRFSGKGERTDAFSPDTVIRFGYALRALRAALEASVGQDYGDEQHAFVIHEARAQQLASLAEAEVLIEHVVATLVKLDRWMCGALV